MDEKLETQPSYTGGSTCHPGPRGFRSFLRHWALAICFLLAGGWLFWSHSCHVRLVSIEERVENILAQTPLIGM